MNLGTLLGCLGISCENPSQEITSVTRDRKNVKEGSLFVAVKGKNSDGNDYIDEAFSAGAKAVVTDSERKGSGIINVSDACRAYSFLSSAFFGNPQDKLKIIGITGTNGKTTTAQYLAHILGKAGKKCAVIGTLGSFFGDYHSKTGYTTPPAEILFRELSCFVSLGAEYVILEVSSQALVQCRVDPIVFHVGVFTNIGRDHLDYHLNMEEYLKAKLRLRALCRKTVVNADSLFAKAFDWQEDKNSLTFSVNDSYADICAKNVRYSGDYISFLILNLSSLIRVKVRGMSEMTLYNSLAAASAAIACGINAEILPSALETLPEVKGRMEKLSDGDKDVYIDFAHTPEALYSVLSALKKVCVNKLWCVFGCGGERDRGKRSEMGKIASSVADYVVITSDNPRGESAQSIADDIIKGIYNNNNIYTQLDRYRAIEYALRESVSGDIVLIAGKGHEEYQITAGEKKYFSDEIAVKNILGV